jgi:hypothetical protein
LVGVCRLEGFTNKYKQELTRSIGLLDLDSYNEESLEEWKFNTASDPNDKQIPEMINCLFEEEKMIECCDWIKDQ